MLRKTKARKRLRATMRVRRKAGIAAASWR